jgi:hypothetical protein
MSCFDIGPDAGLLGEAVAGGVLLADWEPVPDGDAVGVAVAGLTWKDRLTSGAAA